MPGKRIPNNLWYKSSASESANCVEIRVLDDSVQVRNSRDRNGPVLNFTFGEWHAFLIGAARGEFTLAEDNAK